MDSSTSPSVHYSTSLDGIRPEMLVGFFVGWRRPLSSEQHVRLLRNSTHCILAIDSQASRVIGFINALADGSHSAFIPLLEVLPAYQHRGIGGELLRRMLEILADYPCIDLTCDSQLQPFYERHGMARSVGMIIRDYGRAERFA